MGLISKIEDKLSGSNKHEDQNKLEKEQGTGHHGGKTSGYENEPPTSQAGGASVTSGWDNAGSSGTGSNSHDLRHPIQSEASKGYGNDSSQMPSGAQGVGRDGYGGQASGTETGRNKMLPNEPMKPFSSKGQDAAYQNSRGGSEAQDFEQRFKSGRQSEPEDRSAIPTAGGRQLGDPEGQHHYGRDAALAGGAGAAGTGAYEESKHRGHHGTNSRDSPQQSYGNTGDREGRHHHGRDAALAGGAGAVGTGAYEESKHRGHRGTNSRDTPEQSYGNTGESRHHGGRDAALAGGAGAAGTGAYEESKHRGHHGTNSRDNPEQSYGNNGNTGESRHHGGRDAALAGGAGAAGLGAYETNKHRGQHDMSSRDNPEQSYGNTGSGTTGTGGYESSKLPYRGQGGMDSSRTGPESAYGNNNDSQHHYGRDAALAGGAGAAGLGAYETKKHRDQPEQDSRSYGDGEMRGPGHHGQSGSTGQGYDEPRMSSERAMPGQTSGAGMGSQSGLPTEKKLGGAYEAGYRDAMAHMEAERQKRL